MTDIHGSYLYNLTNGKTIGRNTSEVDRKGYKNAIVVKNGDYIFQGNDNGIYSNESVHDSGARFALLSSAYEADDINNDEYGTVEDLLFNQIINLFLNGDMIVSELKIGLEAKGATSIQVTESDGMTIVTFKFNDKGYSLKCSTDAATSQVDDIRNTQTNDSVNVTNDKTHYTPWVSKTESNTLNLSSFGYINSNGFLLPQTEISKTNNNETLFEKKVLDPLFQKYFGHGFSNINELHKLTKEELEFVNAHPGIFPISFNDYYDEWFDAENYPDAWLSWSIGPTIDSEGQISGHTAYAAWLYENGVYPESTDELYSFWVTQFGKNLKENYSDVNVESTPIYNVKFDGNNIEYNDKSIEAIKKYLSQKSDDKPTDYMKAFGFSINDDDETIREKVSQFLKNAGSKDGKTLTLEEYYNAIATNGLKGDTSALNGSWMKLPTYDECVKNYDKFINEIIIPRQKQLGISANTVASCVTTTQSTNSPVSTAISATNVVDEQTQNTSIDVTTDDIETTKVALMQNKLDKLQNLIEKYHEYFEDAYPTPNGKLDGVNAVPIYAIALDDNGNVVIDDNFKNALKKYLTALEEAVREDTQKAFDRVRAAEESGIGQSLHFSVLCQKEFLSMLGLTEISYSLDEESMYTWCDNLKNLINDNSKLEEILSKFKESIGCSKGSNTVSLLQYYNALASFGVKEKNSMYSTNDTYTYSRDDLLEEEAKITVYLENLKEEYSDVYDTFASYIASMDNGDFGNHYYYNGTVYGISYVNLEEMGDDPYYSPALRGVFNHAAGITKNDTYLEKADKMTALFKKIGATDDNLMSIDIIQLMNYLLGDNSEKVNYFNEYLKLFDDNNKSESIEPEYGIQKNSVAITTTAPETTTSAPVATIENEEISIKTDNVLEEIQDAAKKLGLTAAKTSGIYYQFTANGSYLYIWNPITKKFKAFSINTKNADGSINQEFTQSGRAVKRTETFVYYEAILEAYKNGYNFTVNFPWVCEKDGVYYEYDKEAGCFKKK